MNLAETGEPAPDFTLKDEKGVEWKLSDKRGRVVAMLFYPGDETLVCTKQLCSLRDQWDDYVKTGAEIIGISPGTARSHYNFTQHHNLPIPLLVDADASVTRTYSYHWLMPSWMTRAIVVVDAAGVIRSRRIMFRAFRPMDKEVITAIRYAQNDLLVNRLKK